MSAGMSKKAKAPQFDEIGYWSEVKLEIVKKYAAAYSTILSGQKGLHHVYIDAFASTGMHKSKTEDRMIPGSPTIALNIVPPFKEYYFIDIKAEKIRQLKEFLGESPNRHYYRGDCNRILPEKVFPNVRYEDYRRGLCLLDPYGLHLDWKVIQEAGQMESLDIFLNFPIMDMNRNYLWTHPDRVSTADQERMNCFWGDDSWRSSAYHRKKQMSFLAESELEKSNNEAVAQAFRERLRKHAGFSFVPDPMPMRNSKGSTVYYLFFASQKAVAEKVIKEIFAKFRDRAKGHS